MFKMKSPFPYFGGKSRVAADIWAALGQPAHYIEPFFGSGAVLLNRPDWQPSMTETVNDKDGYVANVWRALQSDPDAVARWCDWPVNHADLCARRRVLIREGAGMTARLIEDDGWFDAKLAGYWVWSASCWIGRGLTRPGAMPEATRGKGVHAAGQIPHLTGGKGVHAAGQIPSLTGGTGVHAAGKIPHLCDGGKGVQDQYKVSLYTWFRELSERLRNVRVVCGDWSRVCGGNWQDKIGVCGIFLDPPYGDVGRDKTLYAKESLTVAAEVSAWAVERGAMPSYRIVVAGYDGEHQSLISAGWRVQAWKASGGYGNQRGKDSNNNRHRERLFYSPHCLKSASGYQLFGGIDGIS